jgi:uncharacterized membrane protein YhaH (DUF805 family)
MILPYRRYFDFHGRSRRLEYWWFFVFWVILAIAFGIAAVATIAGNLQAMMQGSASAFAGVGAAFWTLLALFGLFFIGSLIPMIAVQVRRLHDLGVSGWWYLAYVAGGVVLPEVPNVGNALNGLLALGWIVWMFFPGTQGPNRYGEDPKDPVGVGGVFA